jgi:hypothetical protein
MPTRRRSSRVPRAVTRAAAASESPRDVAMATELQQEVAAATAVTAAATAVASGSLVLVPTAGDRAAVVDVAVDDAAPPGVGPMGKLACIRPRACVGGVGDAGGRLHDAAAPGARRRGLVVTRCPARP